MKKRIVKKLTIPLLLLVLSCSVAMAGIPVTCINCSNIFTQLLEYVNDIEQLLEAIKRYEELVKQTENMVTNTMNLPSNLKNNITSQLKGAVSNIERLKNYKGDMDALSTIFTDTWPELKDIKVDGISMVERIETRREQFETSAQKMDNILQSNFQLSGEQLQEMEDSGEFDDYIDDLLSSKEGRQQAIEAGNQINAMTVNELRQTRTLLASYVQAQATELAQKQQEEKLSEAEEEREQNAGVERAGATLPDF